MKKSGFLGQHGLIALIFYAAACPIVAGTLLAFLRSEVPAKISERTLTFTQRVAYQRAIEEVYWRHRLWPRSRGERPDPKPSLSAVMSQAQLESKVADYLRKSQALQDYWQQTITAEQLQAEMDRMAQHTKQPEMLRELFEALGNDPFVVAECLARPALADRLLTNWYAHDQRVHGELRQRAEAEVQVHAAVGQMKNFSGTYTEAELVRSDSVDEQANDRINHSVRLNGREWDQTLQGITAIFAEPISTKRFGVRSRQRGIAAFESADMSAHSKNAYGNLPLGQLSSLQEDETGYYVTAVISKANDRLKLATVTWPKEPLESWLAKQQNNIRSEPCAAGVIYTLPELPTGNCVDDTWTAVSGAPEVRQGHTAVWTGSEMIVWGGYTVGVYFDTGGRYNPSTDTWTATSTANAPAGRTYHTAVWTGSEMIVWGGGDSPHSNMGNFFNTGGRYNPITDSWEPTSTENVPAGRRSHTAVWTGSEMIIWGGGNYPVGDLNTGGRYNPNTNSWTATSTSNAPGARDSHTAVWTGSQMIIWGGFGIGGYLNTGGRYDPNTDSWTTTAVTNAPSGRYSHTAVWTGSEMIIWGGTHFPTAFGDGARYDPVTDTWTATSNMNAPSARYDHTAVWIGNEMIIWGGATSGGIVNTGGRYDPGTDSWIATSTTNAPDARGFHTAVWTGNEMIVWGGSDFNTGGRYNPDTDSWMNTGANNAPSIREGHTAVWTGTEMIIWGGCSVRGSIQCFNTGGRYNPASDNWIVTSTIDAPAGRTSHGAVWTGAEMIVWGGSDQSGFFNAGGKYSPTSDTWIGTSTVNVPMARSHHTAVWTGGEMIVWGGIGCGGNCNFYSGGRYNPGTDGWTSTSTINVPSARWDHTAVWTGSEMIVWGGTDAIPNHTYLHTGGRYNPANDSWLPTSLMNVPLGRIAYTAVWTGSEMIVWGGVDETFNDTNTGGAYNPTSDSWAAIGSTKVPGRRDSHTAVWTGREMIIWGGYSSAGGPVNPNTGGRYNPGTESWTPTSTVNTPIGRTDHTAVWTGNEMIVWGGRREAYLNTGGKYCAQSGAPSPTPTPTASSTPTATAAATATPTATTTATPTLTPRPSPTPRFAPTPRPRPTPPPRP
jgi:N-acetylneuraminic acid mutarotase